MNMKRLWYMMGATIGYQKKLARFMLELFWWRKHQGFTKATYLAERYETAKWNKSGNGYRTEEEL
jgi:Na+(H+)/acetate symporter ActP